MNSLDGGKRGRHHSSALIKINASTNTKPRGVLNFEEPSNSLDGALCRDGEDNSLEGGNEKMEKRSGTYSRIYLHFVWSTKNRVAMIDDEIKGDAVKVFLSKAKDLRIEILEANGPEDHMHVLLKSNPTISPSDIAKGLKGSSSHFVNHVTLKDDESRSLYWQDGFGVTSVSPSAVEAVRAYIRKQKEHHRFNTLIEDYEI